MINNSEDLYYLFEEDLLDVRILSDCGIARKGENNRTLLGKKI
jgi:hypothetical protein